jgi:hypothetical protein
MNHVRVQPNDVACVANNLDDGKSLQFFRNGAELKICHALGFESFQQPRDSFVRANAYGWTTAAGFDISQEFDSDQTYFR